MSTNSKLSNEWHPTLNGKLKPSEVTHGSNISVWWQCPVNSEHIFKATVKSRTKKKYPGNCPYCSGRRVGRDNNLQFLHPEISKEWHPKKNGNKRPSEFTSASHRKVFWLCKKQHSYAARIKDRTRNGSGCPVCNNQTSQAEIRILSELLYLLDDTTSRYRINGQKHLEVDVFIPRLNLGIEYDGAFFHQAKKHKDLQKNETLTSENITLVRVREHPLEKLNETDIIVYQRHLTKTDLNKIVETIIPFVGEETIGILENYLNQENFLNENTFQKLLSYFPAPFPEKSLLHTHPILCKEWDVELNYPLKPEQFSRGSNSIVSWICPKGDKFKMSIDNRAIGGRGCPICAGKKVNDRNSFKSNYPDLALLWHPTLNGKTELVSISSGSSRQVFWMCLDGHEYQRKLKDQVKQNGQCPTCKIEHNSLQKMFPKIAEEWHKSKNDVPFPETISYGSKKVVWWNCKSCGNEYKKSVNQRTDKRTKVHCPVCR